MNQVQPSGKLIDQPYRPAVGRNWLHFDLRTSDQEGEVERLLKLGAKRHPQIYEPDDDFIVLEDPDGNLFCVIQTSKR